MGKSNLVLKDITFPVVKAPVFTLLKGKTDEFVRIPGKTALLNSISNHPLSVVSSDYELITNEQAYEYGEKCMRTMFGMENNSKIELFNVIAPKSLSFCHIDLFADKKDFSFYVGDQYKPFLRITNSYNTMFRLTFTVGFCRWICKNGVIFGEESIEYRFSHTKDFKNKIDFNIRKDEFEILLSSFKIDIETLMGNRIPDEYMFPMFCRALNIKIELNGTNEEEKDKSIQKLKSYQSFFENKLIQYNSQDESNYYDLYNVITDVATYGFKDEHLYVTRVNNRQKRAGSWLAEVSDILRNNKMNYQVYLKDYLDFSRN